MPWTFYNSDGEQKLDKTVFPHAVTHAVGGTDPLDVYYLALSTSQTVAGLKTFTTTPEVPIAAPTVDTQVVNKKFVDDLVLDDLADTIITAPSTHDGIRYDGSDWVNDPDAIASQYFKITLATTYNIGDNPIANDGTRVEWDATTFMSPSVAAFHDPSGGPLAQSRVTPQLSGLWYMRAHLHWDPDAGFGAFVGGGSEIKVRILRDGTPIAQHCVTVANVNGPITVSVATLTRSFSNIYQVFATQNSGFTQRLTGGSDKTHFTGTLIRRL